MAEETEETPTEETPDVETEPRPLTVEERNKPILDTTGQQATGAVDLSIDPDSGITPSLGAGEYNPTDQVAVAEDEDLTITGKKLTTDDETITADQVTTPTSVGAVTQPDTITVDTENVVRVGTIADAVPAEGTIELTSDALINENDVVDDRTKAELLEEGTLAETKTQVLAKEATVNYQLSEIMKSLDGTAELPPWASANMRKVKSMMNARGLGSSSMASAAMVQALMESALPIASSDAQSYSKIQLVNLSNEQQTALANAAAILAIDTKNLDNRMKVASQNAQTFLSMDLENLKNEQQAAMISYQSNVQALLTDAAADNAAINLNMKTENDMNKFYDNLGVAIETGNANRIEASNQFNVNEANSMKKHITKLNDSREKFNANMELQIEQSNALWRRTINTANTAADNAAAQANAAAFLALTSTAQAQLWQKYRDEANYSFTASENEAQRSLQLAITAISNQFAMDMFDKEVDFEDNKASGALLASFIDSILGVGEAYATSLVTD